MSSSKLTIEKFCAEARLFVLQEITHSEPSLFGVTDGKAVGTYIEHKFRQHLQQKFGVLSGNSASGIDFPDLLIDVKVTSARQPQSSCPFKNVRQKIYGLGYSLLIFVYDKQDDALAKSAHLKIVSLIFVEAKRTADFQIIRGIREILKNKGNLDDLIAFLSDKNLPIDEIDLHQLVHELLEKMPEQGFLTISNALQWRLQYTRVIEEAGQVTGVINVYQNLS